MISFLVYFFSIIPHLFYFNLFSFYKRIIYLSINPRYIYYVFLLIGLVTCFSFLFARMQIFLLNNIKLNRINLICFISILILAKSSFGNIYFKNYTITFINQNRLVEYLYDYKTYILGLTSIEKYKCASVDNNSPSKNEFYQKCSTKKSRELLLIVESWGNLMDTTSQKACIQSIYDSFQQSNNSSYTIKFENTCFQGNTASAEGRELLNINSEESYRAFIESNIEPDYNLVKFKNQEGYFTISGSSGSKQYGSNYSNAFSFRSKLGFNKNIFYEDLKGAYPRNRENAYISVSDEKMIDSIINLSQSYDKVFLYGLTINTHYPFIIDMTNVDKVDYKLNKKKLLKYFNNEIVAFNQFYRVSKIIDYVFKKISKSIFFSIKS